MRWVQKTKICGMAMEDAIPDKKCVIFFTKTCQKFDRIQYVSYTIYPALFYKHTMIQYPRRLHAKYKADPKRTGQNETTGH